jgi:integrase
VVLVVVAVSAGPAAEGGAGGDAVPDPGRGHHPGRRDKARYRALVLVGAYGGLRIGELAGLRRGRVDVLRGTVTVAEIVVEVRGVLHIGPPKTRASRRLGELHPGSLRPPVPGGRCGAP